MGWSEKLALLGTAVLLTAGCSSHEPLLKKQAEFDARLDQVVKAQAATNARLSELAGTLADVQAQVKAQGLEVDQLKPGYRELKTSLESTSQKLDKLASEAATVPVKVEPPPPVVPPEPVPTAPKAPEVLEPVVPSSIPVVTAPDARSPLDAQTAYQKAFRLYMADRFTDSLAAFEAFLAANPSHEYAANAQYWIGECLYSLKNFSWSFDAFNKVIALYPKSSKVPDAMLKGALALYSMGQHDKGREQLQRLVDAYPKSVAASKARERLVKEKKR